jgi:hypothetical protein
LNASLASAVVGWWAVPFGPVVTAWCIFTNALGGTPNPKADRRLTLLNAQAFLEMDNFRLAYALARRALDGAEGADEKNAQAIMQQVKSLRIDSPLMVVKNPWRTDLAYVGLHAVMILAAPAAVIVMALVLTGG